MYIRKQTLRCHKSNKGRLTYKRTVVTDQQTQHLASLLVLTGMLQFEDTYIVHEDITYLSRTAPGNVAVGGHI